MRKIRDIFDSILILTLFSTHRNFFKRKINLVFHRVFLQWILIIFFTMLPLSAFSVAGLLLSLDQNPEFSCAVIYTNTEGELKDLCSGEFVSKNWFLTSGNCEDVAGVYTTNIFCTHPNLTKYNVVTKIIHPNYTDSGNPYDQALLQIEGNIPFHPVSLPKNADEINTLLEKKCAIFGYGLNDNRKPGVLSGIPAQFNNGFFGENMVGLGPLTYPTPGDGGAGLLCWEEQQKKWIRVGTISQTSKVGIANAALLSPSLSWILETISKAPDEVPATNSKDNSLSNFLILEILKSFGLEQ